MFSDLTNETSDCEIAVADTWPYLQTSWESFIHSKKGWNSPLAFFAYHNFQQNFISFEETDKLLTNVAGITRRNPNSGSSHYTYSHPDLIDNITIRSKTTRLYKWWCDSRWGLEKHTRCY